MSIPFLMGACQALSASRAPVPFPDALQERAQDLEARGDIASAIRYWEAASAVAAEKVAALAALRRERIASAWVAAEAALDGGKVEEGVTHLLKVLRLDPSHDGARERLRRTLSRQLAVSYTARGGESLETVAGRVYKNVRLAPLVGALHGSVFRKGDVLWLPRVEATLVAAQFNYTKAMSKARRAFKAGDWKELLAASEEILSYAPDDTETLFLKNTAAHNLAEALFQAGHYREALEMYRRVDPNFKNEKPRIDEILGLLKQRQDAARERENSASLNRAIRMEREASFVKSLRALEAVDKGFPGRLEVEQRLKKRMDAEAETHYRAGVQLFLKENLTGAIAEWQQCLVLNPGHLKASEGVENARRLLEKVKGIEPEKRRATP